MRRSLFLLFSFFLGWAVSVQAQYVPENKPNKDTTVYVSPKTQKQDQSSERSGFDRSKLVPGGNFAFSFGNPYYIDVSPTIGYMFTEQLLLGVGANYIALGGDINGYKYYWNYYGGRLLGRHKIFDEVYANAELEMLNVPYFLNTSNEELRRWIVSPLVGASYVYPFGDRGGVQLSALYNLNYQQAYSPYPNAFIWRIGFFL